MINMNNDKITKHFGAEFHSKLLINLPKYTNQWQLSNLEHIDYYSFSCLFTCVSEKHGACVLKFGRYLDLVDTEHYMLKDFDGSGLCRVYESDIDNGVLLIERVLPGHQLSDEPDQDTRINEFCALVQKLYNRPAKTIEFETYMDWIIELTKFIKTQPNYAVLYQKMKKAEEIFRQLWEKYTDRRLLHADLHHENILLGKDGYCAIDPLGVVGDPVFDVLMFILEEVDRDIEGEYEYVVKTISTKLNIPEKDLLALLFVESCKLNCAYVQDGDYDEVDMDGTLFAERMMQ